MPELIELVNKTNSRLLYDDIVHKKSTDQEFQLLNTLEMLWNVEKSEQDKFKGHALTVKEEFLDDDELL